MPSNESVDSNTVDYRVPSDLIRSQDTTTDSPDSPFPFKLDNLCPPAPGLTFSGGSEDPDGACGDAVECYRWDLNGCGFTPGGDVEIEVDGVTTITALANADGCLRVSNIGSSGLDGVRQELPLPPSYHWVIAKEVDDSGPQGAKHAIGFFQYCPNGKLAGDEDGDCDVDWFDFALSASNWLVGTE